MRFTFASGKTVDVSDQDVVDEMLRLVARVAALEEERDALRRRQAAAERASWELTQMLRRQP